jgi:pimeloyl-ACP methyl ester carboxylesterase
MGYQKQQFSRGTATGIYTAGRLTDKIVGVRHNLPGSIILVHGVNDVGTSYEAVENGLCAGLTERLCGDLRPATYSNPKPGDADELKDDPDAIYYKRNVTNETHSPVIPFYWGFREEQQFARFGSTTPHGQALDRSGNRLDKDFSKGGGPFANATSSLPEMWNRGKSKALGILDVAQRDATHPVLDNPGRLYMILAARRLAALITMIRDYDADETVSIVAHSQGCMLSLLAQAFLLETGAKALQANARPADTLILCNPPYSLVDETPMLASSVDYYSGRDAAMAKRYNLLGGGQTLHARLTTLVNIVRGVQKNKHASPALSDLPDTAKHFGVVGAKWTAAKDRDNRGKVYLYFSPEDMTVALANVQGIGWQGIPEFIRGKEVTAKPFPLNDEDGEPLAIAATITKADNVVRKPLAELGNGFFQRVFTIKRRPDFRSGAQVLIGQKMSPYDFVLRCKGEDDQAHTDISDSVTSRHAVRGRLDEQGDAPWGAGGDEKARYGLRKITGEALPTPVVANMGEGAFADTKGRFGAMERVDQIDAAIASTSRFGIDLKYECINDPIGVAIPAGVPFIGSPDPLLFKGVIANAATASGPVEKALNLGKDNDAKCKIVEVFVCVGDTAARRPTTPPKLIIQRTESAKEARLRWQHVSMARSFHGAVYGGSKNHQYVTAYDVAIGGGTATTHPLFYSYLCAVADWRLKDPAPKERLRPGILGWAEFQKKFSVYWKDEPAWRRDFISANVAYYSTGTLPSSLPLPPDGLPSAVLLQSFSEGKIEFKDGKR